MREQVTISGAATARARCRAAAVIIALAFAGLTSPRVSGADTSVLATAAPPAPVLTTVIVDGATAYAAPQLFAAYRDQLGRPISRDGARAIVAALAELYLRDGYVKPELNLDESRAARGVLRVQVQEAQVSSVIFEGDDGRFRAALAEIGARLEHARPLRKDDIPD